MLLEETTFTVFDFETTGLYPYYGDKICEVGAVRFGVHTRKPQTFHCLVNPERDISPGAFRVNGITGMMVRGKPTIRAVLPEFLSFIDGSVLVAYNAGFDVGFLEAALGSRSVILDGYYIIDALKLARRLYPSIGRYGLGSVADALCIEIGREHRALSDAIMTWGVFRKELALLRRDGVKSVEEIDRFRARKVSAPGSFGDREDKALLIKDAILKERMLNIVYKSSWNNQTTNRTISPKKIQHGYESSYIVAFCHMRNEERVFRLDCIIKADVV